MVVTRRQSGALPSIAASQDPEDEYLSDMDTDQDSGSEWEDRTRRQPLLKRARKGSFRETPVKNRIAGVNIIRGLPLDVLFEICGYLTLSDLLNCARTNTEFRRILMSKGSITVWKTARRRVRAPECPFGFSEPSWANLLFGAATCEKCGRKNVQRVDFALRRRLCTVCLKNHLIYAGTFQSKHPDLDPEVLDLIPYTNTSGWAHGHATQSKFFWDDDVYEMSFKLGVYLKDIYMCKPGAQQALGDFKLARSEFVQEVIQHARSCEKWVLKYAKQCYREILERKEARLKLIKDRLLQLGHLEVDLLYIRNLYEAYNPTELTDRAWNRIRPILEAKVTQARQLRLSKERDELIVHRTRTVIIVYAEFKRTLLPMQWASLPHDEDACNDVFGELICEDSERRIQAQDCAGGIAKLPEYLQAHLRDKTTYLLELVAAAKATSPQSSIPVTDSAPKATLSSTSMDVDTLELLFICADECKNSPSILFGLDEALTHICLPNKHRGQTRLQWSRSGYNALVSLLGLTSLRGQNVKHTDLDELDLRFLCMHCPVKPRKGTNGCWAYSWRQAVTHFALCHSTLESPQWRLLNPQETKYVKSIEFYDPSLRRPYWLCCHCLYTGVGSARNNVVGHLKKLHNITNPKEFTDLLYHPAKKRPERILATFPPKWPSTSVQQPSLSIRCLHCPESTRCFQVHGVINHLRDKHKVLDPQQGNDWGKWPNISLLSNEHPFGGGGS